MKKFKKLIPAFCAMLVSAAMLGTSTYAWFSVNKKVEANGMSVTATADTQYFAVLDTLTGGKFTTGKTDVKTSVKAIRSQSGDNTDSGKETYVNPIAFSTAGITGATYGVTNNVAASHWYTASVDKYDGVNANGADIKYSKLEDVGAATTAETTTVYTDGTYFIGYTFYVGLADDTADFTGYLKFEASAVNNGVTVAGVKVNGTVKDATSATDSYVPLADFTGNAKTKGFTANQYSLTSKKTTDATFVTVTVYVFIDGTATNVKDSATVAELTGSVNITVTGRTAGEYAEDIQ